MKSRSRQSNVLKNSKNRHGDGKSRHQPQTLNAEHTSIVAETANALGSESLRRMDGNAVALSGAKIGTLYVVATPIGNLEDITLRALRILKSVDGIYCEDTRTSGSLLAHYGIATPTRSLHQYNEAARSTEVAQQLQSGQSWALISDAGTPLISDPGYRLVADLRAQNLPVQSVPGPSALTAALSVAGMESARFAFEGFLPANASARRAQLQNLKNEPRTLVFFEASHRIVETLQDCAHIFGDRLVAVVKELSKHFERVLRGTSADVSVAFAADPSLSKGEFVLLIAPAPETAPDLAQAQRLLQILQSQMGLSQAAKLVAQYTGVSKRLLYASAQLAPSASD